MRRRLRATVALMLAGITAITGCTPSKPVYLFDDKDMSHYKGMATQIEVSDEDNARLADAEDAKEPFTLSNPNVTEYWDLTLEEAMRTALANAKVLRNLGGLLFTPGLPASNQTIAPTGQLLQSNTIGLGNQGSLGQGQTQQTIYNPAIQESSTSGTRSGLEPVRRAAQLAIVLAEHQQSAAPFFTGLNAQVLHQDYAQQQTEIGKVSAYGSRVLPAATQLQHPEQPTVEPVPELQPERHRSRNPASVVARGRRWISTASPVPTATPAFSPARGPTARSRTPTAFPALTTAWCLARINVDITLADFEAGVRNFCRRLGTALLGPCTTTTAT